VDQLFWEKFFARQIETEPLGGHGKAIFHATVAHIIALNTGKPSQQPRHPLRILIALADMHKQMFTFTAGFKTEYLIDLKIFWLTAVLGAAKGCWKQARETLKIECLRRLCLRVLCLRSEGLRVDDI